jgi:hypothetical protein
MKFSTRLKKLGYCVSKSKSNSIYDDFETYLFDDYRLGTYIEGGNIVISILYFKITREWEVIYKSKNYSKKPDIGSN